MNVKIILLNNNGMSMCKQTERQWFNGKHAATTPESGLGFPDFEAVAQAFNIPLDLSLECLFGGVTLPDHKPYNGPSFMMVDIDPDAGLIPQARFGAPIEDSEPMLSREELKEQMIVGIV